MRNGGAIAKKKMKIAIAAATAPISGRVSTRATSDFLTGAGASAVVGGWVAGVVAGELMSAPGEEGGRESRRPARLAAEQRTGCAGSPGSRGQRRLFSV